MTNVDLNKLEIEKYNLQVVKGIVANYLGYKYTFVSNKKMYNHKDLLKLFKESNCDACAIDPFTGLNHDRKVKSI